MTKKYYEVVFEGKFDLVAGMLEGYLLGKGKTWEWYSSRDSGIETETFTEAIKEWVSLKTRLHHIILEEDFHTELQKSFEKRTDLKYIMPEQAKSARKIKDCSFKFRAMTYAKKYGGEIKSIIESPPAGIEIQNYKPKEHIDDSAKGVELYAPDHDYVFNAEGIVKGEFGSLVSFRKLLYDHPLVEVTTIKLYF